MAIVKFNSSSKPLRGKVGGLVFKHYADKVVVTRAPTFSGKWSSAQQDGRKRFALASTYARTVCADPVLRARYKKIAVRRGLTVRSVVISAYLQGKTTRIEAPKSPVRRPPLVRAKPRRSSSPVPLRCRWKSCWPEQGGVQGPNANREPEKSANFAHWRRPTASQDPFNPRHHFLALVIPEG